MNTLTEAKESKTSPDDLSIEANSLDVKCFDETVESHPHISDTIDEYGERLNTVEALANDVYNAVYKHTPKLKDSDDISPGYRGNRTIVEKAQSTKEYERLREVTRGQEVESALATTTIMRNVLESLSDDELNELNEQSERAKDYDDRQESLQNRVSGLESLLENPDIENREEAEQMLAEARQELQAVNGDLERLGEEMMETSDAIGHTVRMAVRKGETEASEELGEIAGMGCGWGVGAGSLRHLPAKSKVLLAEELRSNPKLKRIAKQLGRLKRIAVSKNLKKVNKVPEEYMDVETGDEIGRVLPSEIVNLDDPDLEILFLKRYVDKQLLQYRVEGKEKVGKGAVVCLLDVSGSMDGVREEWAKAVCLALMEVAGLEKRDFAVVFFSGQVEKVFRVYKDMDLDMRLQNILEIASYFTGGGTVFQEPLDKAREILGESEFQKADIVMITDGSASINDGWLKGFNAWKKAKEVMVQGIMIAGTTRVMDGFCDKTYEVSEMFTNDERERTNSVFSLMS